jgi:hypothetical protein
VWGSVRVCRWTSLSGEVCSFPEDCSSVTVDDARTLRLVGEAEHRNITLESPQLLVTHCSTFTMRVDLPVVSTLEMNEACNWFLMFCNCHFDKTGFKMSYEVIKLLVYSGLQFILENE